MTSYRDNKSIGIVTLSGRFNYGNRLQAYAVQSLLKKLGLHPVTLESTDMKFKRRIKNGVKRFLGMPTRVEDTMTPQRMKAFEEFNALIETEAFSTKDDAIRTRFAACISGSDQVWNPRFMSYGHPEMLPFIEPCRRIALSASIGVSEINDEDKSWFAKEISGFEHISVREHRASEIIKELTGREVSVLIDPTLAIDSEEWRSISSDGLTPTTPYVLTYLLGGLDSDSKLVLSEVARDNAAVIPLTDREHSGEPPAGPAEFISLVANARHVVTDSYHASIFSAIFGVPLTIVRRKTANNGIEMFTRLESLSHTLGLEKNMFDLPSFNLKAPADYRRTYELLFEERKKFQKYLEGSLTSIL